jgi:hypothetical protein
MYKLKNLEEERDFLLLYIEILEDYFKNTSKSSYQSFIDGNGFRDLYKEIKKKQNTYDEKHPFFVHIYQLLKVEED